MKYHFPTDTMNCQARLKLGEGLHHGDTHPALQGFGYRSDAYGTESSPATRGDEDRGTQSGEKERGGSWGGRYLSESIYKVND